MLTLVPDRARISGRFWRMAVAGAGLALGALFLLATPIFGEGHGTIITGRVVNGTAGASSPAELEVVLHAISGEGVANVTTAQSDGDGLFEFLNVEVGEDFAYAVTANYQDVLYSTSLVLPQSEETLELLVYEATDSLDDLQVEADVLLIRMSSGGVRELSAFEAIGLANNGDRTFVPDLDQPASMNFLRFSIPVNATDVEVSSDLPGGRIISVGTGFALTAPVIPGSHQVTASFRLPYEGSRLEIARSFPMGADSFRLMLAEDVGKVGDPGPLTPIADVNVEGASYSAWGAVRIGRGEKINIKLVDLPQPSPLNRLGDAFSEGPYFKIGVPASVGFVLAVLLLYSMVLRRREKVSPSGFPVTTAVREPMSTGGTEGRSLVDVIARLDDQFEKGEVPQEDYERRRQELKSRLLRLALNLELE